MVIRIYEFFRIQVLREKLNVTKVMCLVCQLNEPYGTFTFEIEVLVLFLFYREWKRKRSSKSPSQCWTRAQVIFCLDEFQELFSKSYLSILIATRLNILEVLQITSEAMQKSQTIFGISHIPQFTCKKEYFIINLCLNEHSIMCDQSCFLVLF